jgi:hypothetical protein
MFSSFKLPMLPILEEKSNYPDFLHIQSNNPDFLHIQSNYPDFLHIQTACSPNYSGKLELYCTVPLK